MRETPGAGDLSPAGVPVVVGADAAGRPLIRFMTPARAATCQRQAAGGAARGQRVPTALPQGATPAAVR